MFAGATVRCIRLMDPSMHTSTDDLPRHCAILSWASCRQVQVAGVGSPESMTRANSLRETPKARSVLISRSMLTEGSPASIFATRDWLDLTSLATSTWDSFRVVRCILSPSASSSLSSMYADSSADRPRNSAALPIFQPLRSRRFRFSSRIVVLTQPSPQQWQQPRNRHTQRLAAPDTQSSRQIHDRAPILAHRASGSTPCRCSTSRIHCEGRTTTSFSSLSPKRSF